MSKICCKNAYWMVLILFHGCKLFSTSRFKLKSSYDEDEKECEYCKEGVTTCEYTEKPREK